MNRPMFSSWRQVLRDHVPMLGHFHRALHGAWAAAARWRAGVVTGINRFRFNVLWEARIRRVAGRDSRTRLAKPVVHLYAVCWNEERILPHFMAHYGPMVDHFTIYDNGSTDSTLELLATYPHVTVVRTGRGGVFDEGANLRIKNSAWKESAGKADFVIVCDMDEFLFHPNLDVLLFLMKKHGFTVLKPLGFQMVSEKLPAYDGSHLLTQLIPLGVEDSHNYSKTVLFDPNLLKEIRFSPGCHRSRPEGRVKVFRSDHARLLHYKYVDREEILRKTRAYRQTFSEESRAKGWGRHYLKTEKEMMEIFDRMLADGRRVV